MDLLREIHDRATAVVFFSIISTPDSPGYERVRQMERIAEAGILTGACMMPILPGLCDDEENLRNVVRWTADHGGQFVIASGLTLADQQRTFFFRILAERFPDLVDRYERLYPPGGYGAAGWDWKGTALRLREFCEKHGISDRMPRPIIPGDKRALNKRVVEVLANQVYGMELAGEASHRIWAYRKEAWAIEDTPQDVGLIYRSMGRKGLESIENVGPSMAKVIEALLTPRR